MTLSQIWTDLKEKGFETDKNSVHSYVPIYEKLLAPYRETALNVLEIGLFNGASLRMWSEYFINAKVQGIDCSETPHDGMADLRPLIDEILNSDPYSRLFNCRINIFNAEDVSEVSKRFSGIKFDVIIEDAGHEINQQINLCNIWRPYLAEGGLYIIEDVQDIERDEKRFFDGSIKNWTEMSVIDLRKEKRRYDDVLIVIK